MIDEKYLTPEGKEYIQRSLIHLLMDYTSKNPLFNNVNFSYKFLIGLLRNLVDLKWVDKQAIQDIRLIEDIKFSTLPVWDKTAIFVPRKYCGDVLLRGEGFFTDLTKAFVPVTEYMYEYPGPQDKDTVEISNEFNRWVVSNWKKYEGKTLPEYYSGKHLFNFIRSLLGLLLIFWPVYWARKHVFGMDKWQELVFFNRLGGCINSGPVDERVDISGRIYELSYWSKPEYRNKINCFYLVKILTSSDEAFSFTADQKYLLKNWNKMVENHERHTGIPLLIRGGEKLVGRNLIEYMIENYYLGKTLHLSGIPYGISKPCSQYEISCKKLKGVVIEEH